MPKRDALANSSKQKDLAGKNVATIKRPKQKKQEALTVQRLIHEILVSQLSIPLRQIVNDATFQSYTGSKRPDLLISEFEYDPDQKNESQFIENLVAYAEAKDDCVVGDSDWKDAIQQGFTKAPKLKLPYFIVTNCKTTVFYNLSTRNEIKLNGNPIREFQTIDILRLIKNRLTKNPSLDDLVTNVDSLSTISEAVFNKKLWELAKVYRMINFENNVQKIDFTIGFISLEYFEEREMVRGKKNATKIYWSDCSDHTETYPAEKVVAELSKYIGRLEQESQFGEFSSLMEKVRIAIVGKEKEKPIVSEEQVKQIYDVIDSMKPLHKSGFDLFGAVYEMFANSKEKKDFGEYFTRRHYTHIFAKLLLKDEQYFDKARKFTILDPACGTGGFLTEGFKVLQNQYTKTGTLNREAQSFLEEDCFYGIDVRKENISRTKLNMFLVGDGHTHMVDDNTLTRKYGVDEGYDYVLTNPPVGAGTIEAETTAVFSNRTEVCFLYKVIKLLKDGGKACVLLPDGVLENPQFTPLREDILEKCDIAGIVSLPKFAFAPYTKEKMYAVFFTKKNKAITKIQKTPIWMYIIDNDGLANSDKRFPTKLRNNRNGWLHDEISGWVSTDGEEQAGELEEAWQIFDDAPTNGTEWMDEKGERVKLRKGGLIQISQITDQKSQYCLLPEYYLRRLEPSFVTMDELTKGIEQIEKEARELSTKLELKVEAVTAPISYQARAEPVSKVLNYHSGNTGLTAEEIYQRIIVQGDRYEVLSAATTEEKKLGFIPKCRLNGKELKVLENKEGILVSRKGNYAGSIVFRKKGRYALTDDAYFLTLDPSCPHSVSLGWLVTQYRQLFFDHTSSSLGGNNATWNMTRFFEDAQIDIPSFAVQKTIVSYYDFLASIRKEMDKVLSDIEGLERKQVSASYKVYQTKNEPIPKVLDCHSGNSGLTSEEIYQSILLKGQRYEVLSSSTLEERKLGKVPIFHLDGKPIEVFDGKEGILVIRNGKAGTAYFLDKDGKYTITDHAYILSQKESCQYKISLKWLMYQYKEAFLEYTSNAGEGNATWNMTGFFKGVKVDIPAFEEQLALVAKYESLEAVQRIIEGMLSRIEHFLSRQIIVNS